MECKTSGGVVFRLPDLGRKKLKKVSPSEFLAQLLIENAKLSWANFNRSNVTEVVNHVVYQFEFGFGANMRLLYPFTNPKPQLREEWSVIEKVLEYPLPGVPTPSAISIPHGAPALTFQYGGETYKLPLINRWHVNLEGIEIKQYLRSFIHFNKNKVDIISAKLCKRALKNLAWQGFPGVFDLKKILFKQFDESDIGTLMGSHWSIIWEELRIDRPPGTENAKVSGKKPNVSSGLAVKRSSPLPSQLGRVVSAAHLNRVFETYKMTKLQLEVLESEDRFLSIAVPRSNTHRKRREREGTILETVFDVQQYAGNGFVGAIWYSRSELVVEFLTRAQRNRALHTIPRRSAVIAQENVQPIKPEQPGGPKLYFSWTLPVYPEDTAGALSAALNLHFEGTGYSSFYTFNRFDRPKGYLRIIFHKAHPPLKWNLRGTSFKERRFRKEIVTENDYSLQAEEVPLADDYRLLTELQRDIKAPASTKAVSKSKKGSDKRGGFSVARKANENSATPEEMDEGSTIEKPKMRRRALSYGTDFDSSKSLSVENGAVVQLDGAIYKVPAPSDLPLEEATFNKFTRSYFELGPQERGTLNAQTLFRLYRTFLETQFPDAKDGSKLEAFQRIDFNEAVTNPRQGGLSYRLSIANRNVYHKEFLAMSKTLQAQEASGSSETPPDDNPIASQQTPPTSKGRPSVQQNSSTGRGSNRTRERALNSIFGTSSSSSPSSNLRATTSYTPTRTKQHEPDVLSALERYLDDLDASLQLERELMASVSEQPAPK